MKEKSSVSKLIKIFNKYQGCHFRADKAKELMTAEKNSFSLQVKMYFNIYAD